MNATQLHLARMAAALVGAGHPDNPYLQAALGRALDHLPGHSFEQHGEGMIMFPSDSTPGRRYLCDGNHCECPTRSPHVCWHKGVWMICSTLAAALGLTHDHQGKLVIAFPPEPDEHAPM